MINTPNKMPSTLLSSIHPSLPSFLPSFPSIPPSRQSTSQHHGSDMNFFSSFPVSLRVRLPLPPLSPSLEKETNRLDPNYFSNYYFYFACQKKKRIKPNSDQKNKMISTRLHIYNRPPLSGFSGRFVCLFVCLLAYLVCFFVFCFIPRTCLRITTMSFVQSCLLRIHIQ
jgi:hypothetical protein